MAIADDYANWIVKNADKKGTPEFDTVAAAYKDALGGGGAPASAAAPQGYWDKVGSAIKGNTDQIAGAAKDTALGAVRGAAGIGATLLAPLDAAARGLGVDPNGMVGSVIGRTDRRQATTDATQTLGADPNSFAYKSGKLGAEVAGTAGAGGILAKGAQGLGMSPEAINALRTSGFSTGAAVTPGLAGTASNIAIRSGAGALAGGAQVGLVSPGDAGTGAAIGAALPGALKLVGAAGNALAGTPLTAGRQAAVQAARDAGLVLPPTEINPNALNSAVEGLSGKIKTAQAASFKNQPVINKMAADALGVDPATPITQAVLKGVRDQAGQAYSALRNTGTVTADGAFTSALDGLAAKYKGAGADFPGLVKSDVPDMIDALKQKTFSASGAVDAVGFLRETADKAFAARDTGLARAAKSAADEMEGLLGRHLESTGADPALVEQFQNARQQIAKTYSVSKALNAGDGNVSAKALAKQLDKGAPLSGGLRTIAEAGSAFPEATQPLTRNPNALSPLDYFAGIQNAKSSVGAALAGLAARPLARGALLSPTYQNFAAKAAPVNALAGPAVYRAAPRLGQN